MRVLVVGGTGFIGRYLLGWLRDAGHEVAVLHRGIHTPPLPGIRQIRSAHAAIPIRAYPAEVARMDVDVVIHMVLVNGEDAAAAVAAFAGRTARLVAISSGDVYAAYGRLLGHEDEPWWDGPLTEDAPLRSRFYPHGRRFEAHWGVVEDYEKILAERAILSAHEPQGMVLRLPKVYGPGDPQYTLFDGIQRMADRRPAILLASGQAPWRMTHGYVENVAAAIGLAATSPAAVSRVYNIGEASTPSVLERLRTLAAVMDWPGEIIVDENDRLPPRVRDRLPAMPRRPDIEYDTSRIRRELGYAEAVAVPDALQRTIAWQLASLPTPAATPAAARQLDYAAEDEYLAARQRDGAGSA